MLRLRFSDIAQAIARASDGLLFIGGFLGLVAGLWQIRPALSGIVGGTILMMIAVYPYIVRKS